MAATRRGFLTACALSLLGITGCLASGDAKLVLQNDLEQSVTIDTDITRLSDMRVILQTQQSIEPRETREIPNPIDEPGEYRIQISTREANSGGETIVQIDDSESVDIRAIIGSDGVTFTTSSQ